MQNNIIENLTAKLSKLPGLGPRSSKRIIFHLLKNKENLLSPIIKELLEVKDSIKNCQICNNLDLYDVCSICNDNTRNDNLLCIVENIPDLWALERSGSFDGKYHILGGVLSAIDGINPSQLNLKTLEERIKSSKDMEIIIAISATLDGQTTAHYISKLLSKYGNKITRLAHGVPIGGELDYLDNGTIIQAFKGRVLFD